jgi:hypothetical protein
MVTGGLLCGKCAVAGHYEKDLACHCFHGDAECPHAVRHATFHCPSAALLFPLQSPNTWEGGRSSSCALQSTPDCFAPLRMGAHSSLESSSTLDNIPARHDRFANYCHACFSMHASRPHLLSSSDASEPSASSDVRFKGTVSSNDNPSRSSNVPSRVRGRYVLDMLSGPKSPPSLSTALALEVRPGVRRYSRAGTGHPQPYHRLHLRLRCRRYGV